MAGSVLARRPEMLGSSACPWRRGSFPHDRIRFYPPDRHQLDRPVAASWSLRRWDHAQHGIRIRWNPIL